MTTHWYLLFQRQECSDHYYEPYHNLLGIYKNLEDAVAQADMFVQQAKESNSQCFYYVQRRNALHSRTEHEVRETCYEVSNERIPTREELDYNFDDSYPM